MSRRPLNPDPNLHNSASKSSAPIEAPDSDEAPEERPAAEMLPRPHVAALDAMLGKPFKVLDDGFVRVLDYMGDDSAVVQAARISYGAGTKQLHEDRGLIRYLMRHHHSTPFEMCEIKLHVRVPMDTWRQWVRHRTACLAEGTELIFDLPGGLRRRGRQAYPMSVEKLYEKFQPSANRTRSDKQRNPYFKAGRVRAMLLRQMNEDTGLMQHTRVVNVYKNGPKPVFRMTLSDGKTIECTADHRFKFADGWKTLASATGLRLLGRWADWIKGRYEIYVNGRELTGDHIYHDASWLNDQYNVQKRKIADIADLAETSYHTIRKWLRKCGLSHAKGGRSKLPWNAGRRYRLGPRQLSAAFLLANQRARSGAASNFWRGGVTLRRASIGRWTQQAAQRVHERNGWTCQLCHRRASVLHAHHIVPVWADGSRGHDEANLTTLCVPCHRKVHLDELAYVERLGGPPVRAEWVKRPRHAWNKLVAAKLVRIDRFEYVGEKETFDVEVEGPYHNFVANGIVTHNSVNEYSTRYSVAIDAAQQTPPDQWRLQSPLNRQGSGGTLPVGIGEKLAAAERALQDEARRVYEERLAAGVAREQARKDLPLSTYTEAYWKINLHNLLHFLGLRMDDHAQEEIRAYARVIGEEIVAVWVPFVWEAFLDYRRRALHLSSIEAELVRLINLNDRAGAIAAAERHGLLNRRKDGSLARNRERAEFEQKLAALGLAAPWT